MYQPRVDLYNLHELRHGHRARRPRSGPSYGAVSNIQRGRLIKIGMHVDFGSGGRVGGRWLGGMRRGFCHLPPAIYHRT